MFERFTEKAIKVIMLSQEEARRLGHNFVGTDFMLLGLIGEATGIAAKTLKSKGVNLKDARVEVEKNIGRGTGFVAVEVPFTRQAKRLMESAWQEAREQLGQNYIGPEHLLLGLITVGDDDQAGNAGMKVLSTLGVNIDELRTETIEAAKKPKAEVTTVPRWTDSGVNKSLELSTADDTKAALLKALEAIRHAKLISIQALDFDVAAWLREVEAGLVERIGETHTPPRLDESTESADTIINLFTEQAQKAYSLAQEESRRLGHNFIGTEQILLGLIGEGTGIAAKTLKSMGVNLKEARTQVEKIIGRGSGFVSKVIRLTPRGERVIRLSYAEAKELRKGHVGTEHLLLGLVREREGVAARVLEAMECPLERVRKQVMKSLKEDGTAS